MKFRKNYEKSKNKPTVNLEPSMTQPEHEADLEINSVMARYVATGYLPLKDVADQFMDLSVPMDFDAAQDKILRARALFLDLPIEVKDEFRTADEFLKAFQTPRGRDKLESVGILKKKPVDPQPVAGSGVQPQVKAPSEPPAS